MSTSLLQEELLEPPVTLKAPLSPRQRNTLNRLLEGESEKEVAKEMGLSHHTVHIYVKQLYRYYGVRSRAELQSWFYKRAITLLVAGRTVEATTAWAAPRHEARAG